MAFRRKKIKDENGAFITKPRKCYICKEKKAFHTMHGGLVGHYNKYAGKLCCNDCVGNVRLEEKRLTRLEGDPNDMSEGEYQAYGHLF